MSDYAGTWDELARFDRPLLLDMITPDRFSAATLLLGMDERSAWVATAAGPVLVELGELGLSWSGSYRLLWRPPAGFSHSLAVGDDSPVVARVAESFARLDGQQQALAGSRFTPALETRVRLFQQEQGLKADGVVGLQTLFRLNERLGISPTAAQARARLETAATVSAP